MYKDGVDPARATLVLVKDIFPSREPRIWCTSAMPGSPCASLPSFCLSSTIWTTAPRKYLTLVRSVIFLPSTLLALAYVTSVMMMCASMCGEICANRTSPPFSPSSLCPPLSAHDAHLVCSGALTAISMPAWSSLRRISNVASTSGTTLQRCKRFLEAEPCASARENGATNPRSQSEIDVGRAPASKLILSSAWRTLISCCPSTSLSLLASCSKSCGKDSTNEEAG